MIIEEWRKFKGWDVLEFFLKEGRRIHLKGLSRELKISPRTAQLYLHFYEKNGIITKERIGNLTLYELGTGPVVFEFKRLYFLLQLFSHVSEFTKENPEINTLVLYGSHASGEYDRQSDVDLLVISQNKRINLGAIKAIEQKLGKEVRIQMFSVGEWKSMVNKNDNFAISILKKHILLYGAGL